VVAVSFANLQLIGRNLFFFDRSAEDIDPESMLGNNIGGQGISAGSLPTTRSLGLNLTLKF
jgi:iron complex outermembrane receptor protein